MIKPGEAFEGVPDTVWVDLKVIMKKCQVTGFDTAILDLGRFGYVFKIHCMDGLDTTAGES